MSSDMVGNPEAGRTRIGRAFRGWAPFLIAAGLIVGLPAALIAANVWYQRSGVVDTTMQASSVRLTADPRSIAVGVAWPEGGMCLGEFTAHASETSSEVRVWMVHHLYTHPVACAGVGTPYQTAWDAVALNAPLGDRMVVRAGDGTPVPVLAAGENFIGRHPQSADISEYGGLSAGPPQALEKEVRVGEARAAVLAAAIDALPPFPIGTMSCPFDDGSYYAVHFTYRWGVQSLKIAAAGCRGVYASGSSVAAAWAGSPNVDVFDLLRTVVGG